MKHFVGYNKYIFKQTKKPRPIGRGLPFILNFKCKQFLNFFELVATY